MKPHQKKQPLGSLFKSNFASGLVVFLVALPLCLGIALASGAPPLSGVLAGIVGGIVIGSLSTSHISVSGPAAGLAAIILAAITELGSFELFLCAGLIAGAIQLLLGFIRAGSLAEYIPVSVIEGMLAGIGVIIIMKQIPFALGSNGSLADPAALFADIHTGSLLVASGRVDGDPNRMGQNPRAEKHQSPARRAGCRGRGDIDEPMVCCQRQQPCHSRRTIRPTARSRHMARSRRYAHAAQFFRFWQQLRLDDRHHHRHRRLD